MPTLQFFLPDSSTTFFDLPDTEKLTIGASAENDLQVVDGSISRAHAELVKGKDGYRIKDLGSTNKTWVNDVAVVDVPLKPGITLRLGHVEGRLEAAKEDAAPSTTLLPLAFLQITSGEHKGITHRFRAHRLTLGWKSQNIIRLKDPSVSGSHAEIVFEKGGYRVKDLQSSNHTFVNGTPVTDAPLKNGDAVGFGALEATFILPEEAPAKPAKPAKGETPKAPDESNALRKEIETLTGQLKSTENSVATLKKEAAHLKEELEKAKAAKTPPTPPAASSDELSAAKKEIEALSKQREAADAEAATLAAKLDDERQQSESIAVANTQLQLDLDMATNRLKDLEKRLATVTQERDAALQSVIEMEHQFAALQAEHAAAPGEKPAKTAARPPAKPAAPAPALKKSGNTVKLDNPATVKELIEEAPHAFTAMRKLLHTFIKNQREITLLDQLLSNLHGLSIQADKAQLKGAVTMTRALEAMINELISAPSQVTSSSLRSISQSLDFLSTLFEEKNIGRLESPLTANIFAVDDDPDARKVIRAAMEVIQLNVTCAEDPGATLAILNEQVFDLIFIDVGLPEMNGFELCTKIRALPQHRKTPVVFLTGAVTVQNRVQSSLSGGNDFIAKPFNLLELGVKALTWILKGQLGLP